MIARSDDVLQELIDHCHAKGAEHPPHSDGRRVYYNTAKTLRSILRGHEGTLVISQPPARLPRYAVAMLLVIILLEIATFWQLLP